MTFRVGEVRVTEDKDFDAFQQLCHNDEGWKPVYDKKGTRVFTKSTPGVSVQMMKVKTTFEGLAPETVYDVLHDEEYRKEWDKNMTEGYQICMVDPNSDICYYALRLSPLKSRDFVMQRSWLSLPGDEYMIFNHSVSHTRCPVRKSAVRAISVLTGYHMRPAQTSTKNQGTSTAFTYLAQCDPRGRLPTWIVNKAYQLLAPRIAQRLYKAASKYTAWKNKHNPDFKPWLNPEQQMALPRLNWDDVQVGMEADLGEVVDETQLKDDPSNGAADEEED